MKIRQDGRWDASLVGFLILLPLALTPLALLADLTAYTFLRYFLFYHWDNPILFCNFAHDFDFLSEIRLLFRKIEKIGKKIIQHNKRK